MKKYFSIAKCCSHSVQRCGWTKRSLALMMALALVLSAVPQNLAFAKEVDDAVVSEADTDAKVLTSDNGTEDKEESAATIPDDGKKDNEESKPAQEEKTEDGAESEDSKKSDEEAKTDDMEESEEQIGSADEEEPEDQTESENEEAESLGTVANGSGKIDCYKKYYKSTTSYGVTGYPVLVGVSYNEKDVTSPSVENLDLSLSVDGQELTIDKSRVKLLSKSYSIVVNFGYFSSISTGTHNLKASITLKGKNGTDYKYEMEKTASFVEETVELPEVKTEEAGSLRAVSCSKSSENSNLSIDDCAATLWGEELAKTNVTSIKAVGSKDGRIYGESQGSVSTNDFSTLRYNYPIWIDTNIIVLKRDYAKLLDSGDYFPGTRVWTTVNLSDNVQSDMVFDLVFYSQDKEVYRIKNAVLTVGKRSSTKIITDGNYNHSNSVNIAAISTDNSKQYVSYYVYGKNLTKEDAPVFYSTIDNDVVVASYDENDPNCGVDAIDKFDVLDVVMFTLKKNLVGEAKDFWNNDSSKLTAYAEFNKDITHVDKTGGVEKDRFGTSISIPKVYNVIECKNSFRIYFVDTFAKVGDSVKVDASGYKSGSFSVTANATVLENDGQVYVEVSKDVFDKISGSYYFRVCLTTESNSISTDYIYTDDYPWVGYDKDGKRANLAPTISAIAVGEGRSWEIHDLNHATKAIYSGTTAPMDDQISALAKSGELYRVCIKDSKGNRDQVGYVYFEETNNERYQITYDFDGGDWPAGYKATNDGNPYGQYANYYTTETGCTLGSPEKAGFDFDGWYIGSTKITSLKGYTGDQTLVAHWTPAKYTIEFDPNGATGAVYEQTISYGSQIKLTPCKFKLADSVFAGWSRTPDGTKEFDDGQPIDNEFGGKSTTVRLYAKWTSNKVSSIDFLCEKGTYVDSFKRLYFDSTELVEACGNADKLTFKVTATAKNSDKTELSTKLVWTSEDKTIASVTADSADSHQATITIPKKACGIVKITATAQDSGKHAGELSIFVMDYTPIIPNKTAVINSWSTENSASIRVYPAFGSSLSADSLKLLQSYKNGMEVQWKEVEGISLSVDGKNIVFTATKLFTENTKTLTNLKLVGNVGKPISGDLTPFEVSGITVNIKNASPAVAITQVASNSASGTGKNFNLFYKNETAAIKFTAKGAKVTSVSIVPDGETDPKRDGKETFKVYNWDQANQILTIAYEEEANRPASLDKKLVFRYEIEGYNPQYTVNTVPTKRVVVSKPLTIATEYKKPVLVQSRTTTPFSVFSNDRDAIKYYVWTKGTAKTAENALKVKLPTDASCISFSENQFKAVTGQVEKNKKIFTYFGENGSTGKASLTLQLIVSDDNWMETIPVNHTFTINSVAPVLKFTDNKSKATVNTLLYTGDTLSFELTPSNVAATKYVDYGYKRLDTGKALEESENLEVSVDKENRVISVKVADGKTVKKGNYRFALTCTAQESTSLYNSSLKIKDLPFTVAVVDTLPVITLKPAQSTVNLMTKEIAGTSEAQITDQSKYNVQYKIYRDATNKLTDTDLRVKIYTNGNIIALIGNADALKANTVYKYRVKAQVKLKEEYTTNSNPSFVELPREVVYSVKVISAEPSLVVKQVQGKSMGIGKGQPLTYTVTSFKNVTASSDEIFNAEYKLEQYEYVKTASGKKEYVLITDESKELFTLKQTEMMDKKGNPTGVRQLEISPKNPSALSSTTSYYIKLRVASDFRGIAASKLSTGIITFKPVQTAYTYTVTGDNVLYKNCPEQGATFYITVKNVEKYTPANGKSMLYGSGYARDKNGEYLQDPVFLSKGGSGLYLDNIKYEENRIIVSCYVSDSTQLKVGKKYSFTMAMRPNDSMQDTKPVNVKVTFTVK